MFPDIFSPPVTSAITFNPTAQTVDETTKSLFPYWCMQQTSNCLLICEDNDKTAKQNDCDPKTLTYSCVCSNGLVPNSSGKQI
ncbi:hypothetical protein BC938DRAFT_476812 [Jimgerdemannia flammicorona]|uniref:DUF7707 domain-containing protein n=1 Tax=Jimgerdemannia flammicorona TaxID=994334 RepID=A0A433QQ61_9FUNG|nr:hypothetical protein BC938DRAFT_476812 [Jimgerdemannia flammicorona]